MSEPNVTQAVEWATKVAKSKPPRYTDASRNAARFILESQSAQAETLAVLEQAQRAMEDMIPMPGNDRQMHGTYAQGVFDALTILTAKIEELKNGQD